MLGDAEDLQLGWPWWIMQFERVEPGHEWQPSKQLIGNVFPIPSDGVMPAVRPGAMQILDFSALDLTTDYTDRTDLLRPYPGIIRGHP